MCGQAVFDGDATYAQLQEPTGTGSSTTQYRFMSFDMSSGTVEVSSIAAGAAADGWRLQTGVGSVTNGTMCASASTG